MRTILAIGLGGVASGFLDLIYHCEVAVRQRPEILLANSLHGSGGSRGPGQDHDG